MNIKIARLALQQLRNDFAHASPEQRPQIRLAARWIVANEKQLYDQMLRAQVLEGAAGVPLDTWWKQGKLGLAKASRTLREQKVNPAWFSPESSGMFIILEKILKGTIIKYPLIKGLEPLDVFNNAIMGVPLKADSPKERLRPAYEMGKHLRNKILDGTELPEALARGALGALFIRRVSDHNKSVRLESEMPTDDEGAVIDFSDTKPSQSSADFLLGNLIHGTDPGSRKIQEVMREAFSISKPMTLWLDIVTSNIDYNTLKSNWIMEIIGKNPELPGDTEGFDKWKQELEASFDAETNRRGIKIGRIPDLNDMAFLTHIAKGSFYSNHWKKAWPKFSAMLQANRALSQALAYKMESEGFEGDLPDAIEAIEEDMGKTSAAAHRVASMFTLRQALDQIPVLLCR